MNEARTRLANHPVCDVYILFILYKLRRPFARDMGDTHTDYTSRSTLGVIREYLHIYTYNNLSKPQARDLSSFAMIVRNNKEHNV